MTGIKTTAMNVGPLTCAKNLIVWACTRHD